MPGTLAHSEGNLSRSTSLISSGMFRTCYYEEFLLILTRSCPLSKINIPMYVVSRSWHVLFSLFFRSYDDNPQLPCLASSSIQSFFQLHKKKENKVCNNLYTTLTLRCIQSLRWTHSIIISNSRTPCRTRRMPLESGGRSSRVHDVYLLQQIANTIPSFSPSCQPNSEVVRYIRQHQPRRLQTQGKRFGRVFRQLWLAL